jgi:ribose transport system substrate-binding protein
MRFGWILPALALAQAGCGKEESVTPAPPAPDTAGKMETAAPGGTQQAASAGSGISISTEELDKVGRAARPYRVVLVVKTRNNPFFTPMIEAAQAEAKALGMELETQAPPQEVDKEQQFSMVQNVIARGADAILIAPADSKGIVPALMQAQEKGILVINLDNRVDGPTAQAAGLALGGYVGADNEAGGRLAGQAMVEALGGQGKVAILEGIRGADNAEARKRGFTAGVQGKLEIAASDSAEWLTDRAYTKFQSMLAANKDLKGLFCANDKMAIGALKAIREAGQKGKVTVIGYDNIPDVKEALASGELYATIEQHPDLMGRYGVRMAVGVLGGSIPKGREYLVPLEVIKKL